MISFWYMFSAPAAEHKFVVQALWKISQNFFEADSWAFEFIQLLPSWVRETTGAKFGSITLFGKTSIL